MLARRVHRVRLLRPPAPVKHPRLRWSPRGIPVYLINTQITLTFVPSLLGAEDNDPSVSLSFGPSLTATAGVLGIFGDLEVRRAPYNPATEVHQI